MTIQDIFLAAGVNIANQIIHEYQIEMGCLRESLVNEYCAQANVQPSEIIVEGSIVEPITDPARLLSHEAE